MSRTYYLILDKCIVRGISPDISVARALFAHLHEGRVSGGILELVQLDTDATGFAIGPGNLPSNCKYRAIAQTRICKGEYSVLELSELEVT